jgi:hypothetical protein
MNLKKPYTWRWGRGKPPPCNSMQDSILGSQPHHFPTPTHRHRCTSQPKWLWLSCSWTMRILEHRARNYPCPRESTSPLTSSAAASCLALFLGRESEHSLAHIPGPKGLTGPLIL